MATTIRKQTEVNNENNGLSYEIKTIITVILLFTIYPAGLILMYLWMKWPKWIKILVSLPVLLGIFGIVAAVVLVSINPKAQIEKARQAKELNMEIQCRQNCQIQNLDEEGSAACIAGCTSERNR